MPTFTHNDHQPLPRIRPGAPLMQLLATTAAIVLLTHPLVAAAEELPQLGPEHLPRFCDGRARELEITRAADARFGISYSPEKWEWTETQIDQSAARLLDEMEVPYEQWSEIASREEWGQRCEALERGWVMVEEADARAATEEDSRTAAEALELAYLAMLDRGEIDTVRSEPYSAVRCTSATIEAYRLVGCTLAGGGFLSAFYSDPLIFLVAHKDGKPAFVPLENSTKEQIRRAAYTNAKGDRVLAGWYVGSYPYPFEWAEVVGQFAR